MLVASNNPDLRGYAETAAQSPFVIAVRAAGFHGLPSVVNAVVITSAWSSSNQALLAGTRVLYALALKGQAPKIFLRTTSWGIPYVCVLLQTAFMCLAFMTLSSGALNVFWWLVDLTAVGVLISWCAILINHQRLMMAMKVQGIPLKSLPWVSLTSCLRALRAQRKRDGIRLCYNANVVTAQHLDSIRYADSSRTLRPHSLYQWFRCLYKGRLVRR